MHFIILHHILHHVLDPTSSTSSILILTSYHHVILIRTTSNSANVIQCFHIVFILVLSYVFHAVPVSPCHVHVTTHMPNAHTLRLNFQDSEAVVDNFLRLKRRPSSVLQELDKLLTFVTGSPSASPASPASASALLSASSVASWLHLWYFQGMGGIGMELKPRDFQS